jgi:lysophospholipase L1-like esterase
VGGYVKKATAVTAGVSAFAAAGVIAAVVGLSSGSGAVSPVSPVSVRSPVALSAGAATRRTDVIADRDRLRACEQRLEADRRADSDRVPVVAILGGSYTAGVGPDEPDRAWAVLLAEKLHWDAVVYGVSGAGYLRTGSGDGGPLARMLDRTGLHGLHASLVIVQLGHDDVGEPLATERRAVERDIAQIRAEDPSARIALITVFTTPNRTTAADSSTDRAIVSAAESADSDVIIMDPLAGHWNFQHAYDGRGLHPTAAGDAWIAGKVASILSAHGVRAATGNSDPVVCDSEMTPHRPV